MRCLHSTHVSVIEALLDARLILKCFLYSLSISSKSINVSKFAFFERVSLVAARFVSGQEYGRLIDTVEGNDKTIRASFF